MRRQGLLRMLRSSYVLIFLSIISISCVNNNSTIITKPSAITATSNLLVGEITTSPTISNIKHPSSTLTPFFPIRSETASITSTSPHLIATQSPRMEPTLTYDRQTDFISSMLETNGECELPCFWGIIPGETSWRDVQKMITHLGFSYFESQRGKDSFIDFEYRDKQNDLIYGVLMHVSNGIVDIIINDITIRKESLLFTNYKEIFSLRSILLSQGIPDRIWMSLNVGGEISDPLITDNQIYLFYDRRGILINYFGEAKKLNDAYQSCPNLYDKENHDSIWSSMFLQSPQSNLPLEDIVGLWQLSGEPVKPITLSIEEATQLSILDFYDLITQNGDAACFSTPRNLWP